MQNKVNKTKLKLNLYFQLSKQIKKEQIKKRIAEQFLSLYSKAY